MLIGIIGAMECETTPIRNKIKNYIIKEKAHMIFHKGRYESREIVLVTSGIGKVNAAVCTQILIDDFSVDLIINVGVAGGIKTDIELGDVVIALDLIQHDVDGSSCNYRLGQVPKLSTFSFKCNDSLVEKAFSNIDKDWNFKVHKGRIITGDQIISSTNRIDFFRKEFDPHAVEMESAAIGHTCYLNNIPFLIIRAISDYADENLNSVYDDNEIKAVENSIKVLTNLLNCM
jgi:adenosylhomocysteine nucleosidase